MKLKHYFDIFKHRKTVSIGLLILLSISQYFINPVFAQNPPTSSNYKVLEYGFGAGGVASASSNGYSLFGTLGQVDQGSPASSLYFLGAGFEYEAMASVSAAPTFTNPSSYYNKLHIKINRGGNDPTDYQYAIAISASDTEHFQYVKPDHTLEAGLNDSDWQSYTSWGASSGIDIVDLQPGTTYYARVAARQGNYFTQSLWSPIAMAATVNSSLSFDIDTASTDSETAPPYTIDIGNLSAGTVTTSNSKVWIDFSTNAINGGFISVSDSNNGLQSSTASYTISSSTNDLTAQSSGYGARSVSAGQTSGGPMEALAPYNGSSNNVGVLDSSKRYMFDSASSAVTGGRVAFELKAKASNTTPAAGDYSDLITILVTGSF